MTDPAPALTDTFDRRIDYLRISVTDRCNLRCAYCMPAAGVAWQPRQELLTFEEITALVSAAAGLGVRRVRLTGGEPLVRPGIVDLVGMLARVPGIEDVSLTTNGVLLGPLARPLADAGLDRVNVSLDTLDRERFARLTRRDRLPDVLAGLAAAEAAGLGPVKLNTVIVRGVNDDELVDLALLTRCHPWHVRFIELMPIGNDGDWGLGLPVGVDRRVPVEEMRARLQPLGLAPVRGPDGGGPARSYRLRGGLTTVGFITPVSQHFCGDCNRLRLTADGRLRPCLLSTREFSVRDALRGGADPAALLRLAVAAKPVGHPAHPRSTHNGRLPW